MVRVRHRFSPANDRSGREALIGSEPAMAS